MSGLLGECVHAQCRINNGMNATLIQGHIQLRPPPHTQNHGYIMICLSVTKIDPHEYSIATVLTISFLFQVAICTNRKHTLYSSFPEIETQS